MKKRVIIVHRWGATPESDWLPWLKKELEEKGFRVSVPEMPDTDEPKIEAWVGELSLAVGEPNEKLILVGHSIGCQAILRYLETLRDGQEVGGVVFVAPWLTLQNLEDEESEAVAAPWLETAINFEKAKSRARSFTAIFSDNDPFVNLENKEMFEKNVGANTLVLPKQGHFTEDEGVAEVPVVLEKILEIWKN